MKIMGLQKLTLLDFPGKVACTLFLGGCNFRCPFCHNSDLLDGCSEPLMDTEGFLSFLHKRQGMLDAVCVSGGEPTLQPELPRLLAEIKALGFAVKLDTNGYRPQILKALVADNLVDYVAMDVKNSPACYGQTIGLSAVDQAALEESLVFLMEGHVDYELRTTVVQELHTEASILEMGQWLSSLCPGKKTAKLFLQCFVDRESVLLGGLHAPLPQTLSQYVDILTPYVDEVSLRGV